MSLNITGYFEQILYAFNKLKELSFEKRKSHNPSLVVGLRTLVSILKYEEKPKVDITDYIFRLGILLKKSKLFTSAHIDQQLLKEIQDVVQDRNARKHSLSPIQSFTS